MQKELIWEYTYRFIIDDYRNKSNNMLTISNKHENYGEFFDVVHVRMNVINILSDLPGAGNA
ncbi:MAG: hypothetical protein ACUZ8E_14135 [Candidatus Anammoxibacter sp.]